jgi:ssDNA-binding Zn-finger/Zn-ribbon topoisomerase 1
MTREEFKIQKALGAIGKEYTFIYCPKCKRGRLMKQIKRGSIFVECTECKYLTIPDND